LIDSVNRFHSDLTLWPRRPLHSSPASLECSYTKSSIKHIPGLAGRPLKPINATSIKHTSHTYNNRYQQAPISPHWTNIMRLIHRICCLAAFATTAVAQAAYPVSTTASTASTSSFAISSVPASSVSTSSVSISSVPSSFIPLTTSAASSAVQMTTYIMPSNCTSACTTVIEPCPYASASPAPYGTGSWTAPPAPLATGGYVAPPPSTYNMPAAPSVTPISEPSASSSVVRYTGVTAERVVGSGMMLVIAGLLHVMV
jgi:hypothetical protein